MAIKPPPGRAGRAWLLRRLDAGRRGAEVLDHKRQALLRERERLAALLDRTEREWDEHAREAAAANARALTLVGERRLRLAAVHSRDRAELTILRRSILGTNAPEVAEVRLPRPFDVAAIGGPAVAVAAAAHRRALEAAAAFAAVRAGYTAVQAELRTTNRRLRAIERRWLPQHEQALARLDLSLDESERDDIARVRWALTPRAGEPPA